MLARPLSHYKALERDARRPLSAAAHPDDCPKLLLHGVGFAVPPAAGRIVPRFGPEGVRVETQGGEEYPEAFELRRALAPLRKERLCPRCRQPVGAALEIDLERGRRALELAFAVAAKVLRRQYDLSDAQLADLLAFSAGSLPEWFGQIVRYCHGLPPEGSPRALPAGQADPAKRTWLRRLLGR